MGKIVIEKWVCDECGRELNPDRVNRGRDAYPEYRGWELPGSERVGENFIFCSESCRQQHFNKNAPFGAKMIEYY